MVNENSINDNSNNPKNFTLSNHVHKDYKLNQKIKSNSSLSFIWFFSIKETCSRKCYFCLCLFSCLLVTIIALVANTILSEGPIIFVIMAENSVGEIDFSLSTKEVKIDPVQEPLDNMIFYSSLNYTHFINKEKLYNTGMNLENHSSYRLLKYGNTKACLDCKEHSTKLFVINTKKEESMKLGREYKEKEFKLEKNQCVVHQSLYNKLSKDGSRNNNSKEIKEIYFDLTLEEILKNSLLYLYASKSSDNNINDDEINLNLSKISKITNYNSTFKCEIKHIISDNKGKTESFRKNTLFMESEFFLSSFFEGLDDQIISAFPNYTKDFVSKYSLKEFSNNIVVNFPDNRLNAYLESDFNLILDKGVDYSNRFIIDIMENFYLSMPVINELEPLYYGSVFFGLILNIIIVILFGLSIILIYSLLMITMETSTYDLALLRLIGNSKINIIVILVMQCLAFSIPAFIIGYICHFFILNMVSKAFTDIAGTQITLEQDPFSVIYSFLLCNLGPLIAAYFPINTIIGQNLAEALNTNISKTSGVKISIVSSVKKEQNVLITFGILTIIYGISIYYFLPLSLLSMNLSLLLAIFLWILLGMLIGFILLTLNIDHITQKCITYIFFFWTQTYTKTIIIKNLIGHRLRNQKTSLMFSLSVGFFIMISVGSKMEINSSTLTFLKKNGARIVLKSSGEYYTSSNYMYNALNKMIEEDLIKDYSYITPPVNFLCNSQTQISNIGKAEYHDVKVFGVTPNFFNTTENVFLKIDKAGYNELIPDSENFSYNYNSEKKIFNDHNKQKTNPSEWLYALESDGQIGVSSFFKTYIDIDIDEKFILTNTYESDNKEFMILSFKTNYLLSSSPAINMAKNSQSSLEARAVLLPLNIYADILVKCSNNFYDEDVFAPKSLSYDFLPINEIMILPRNETKKVLNRIEEIISNDSKFIVSTYYASDAYDDIETTKKLIDLIFVFVAFVILLFCFFNLTASMSVNMYEQQKELAVYRSLGLSCSFIQWVYVAESFILIVSSCFLGLIVGTIISWTMLIQRVVFTDLPLSFDFPYIELVFLVGFALIGGFFSTYFTSKKIVQKQIATLMKS